MRRQGRFEFRTWGGKRRGAGRKRVAARRQVAHRPRERVNAQHPILVTTKMMPDVARLRTKVMFEAVRAALEGATKWMYEAEPVRFVHASVQGGRVAPGCPGAPTDPDVRISRIRLFSEQVRCALGSYEAGAVAVADISSATG
jgi:hypothetical protein